MIIKYLGNGEEVMLLKKLDEGYLIKRVYITGGEDDIESGEIEFVEKVYDSPPTEKISEEITRLDKIKDALKADIVELMKGETEAQASLKKATNIPHFQMIIDYFNGDYEWVLIEDSTIRKASSVFNSHNVRIELVKGELRLYTLNNDYFGSDRKWVTVFKTKEEAEKEQRKRIIAEINGIEAEWRVEDVIKKYPDLAVEEEIKLLCANKKSELHNKGKIAAIENARKQIEIYNRVLEKNR